MISFDKLIFLTLLKDLKNKIFVKAFFFYTINSINSINSISFLYISLFMENTTVSSNDIRQAFVDYVLTNHDTPPSVYALAKKLGISEGDFYAHYASLKDIDSDIWKHLFLETQQKMESEEVYLQYSVREKALAFAYTWLEILKANRSYVLFSVGHHKAYFFQESAYVLAFKDEFHALAETWIREGTDTQEVQDRPFLTKYYPKLLWKITKDMLHFWVKDHSSNFEKTDVFVEKSINLAFDALGKTPLDSAFDFLKFKFQNR